jgi:hypothetical protein
MLTMKYVNYGVVRMCNFDPATRSHNLGHTRHSDLDLTSKLLHKLAMHIHDSSKMKTYATTSLHPINPNPQYIYTLEPQPRKDIHM